jgi:hypothetical protein
MLILCMTPYGGIEDYNRTSLRAFSVSWNCSRTQEYAYVKHAADDTQFRVFYGLYDTSYYVMLSWYFIAFYFTSFDKRKLYLIRFRAFLVSGFDHARGIGPHALYFTLRMIRSFEFSTGSMIPLIALCYPGTL